MSRTDGLRLALLAGAVAVAATLAGCGKQGVLEQPPPLFGAKAKADYEARKAEQDRDDAQRAARTAGTGGGTPTVNGQQQGPGGTGSDNAPITTRDIQDPSQKLNPASTAPIAGAPAPLSSPPSTRPNF
jgi:predicted small lipoprotein YifL